VNFLGVVVACSRMKVSKCETSFIKYDIAGDINSNGPNVKALKLFVHITIAKECTTDIMILKFVIIIRA
jgi:hypothetical protein